MRASTYFRPDRRSWSSIAISTFFSDSKVVDNLQLIWQSVRSKTKAVLIGIRDMSYLGQQKHCWRKFDLIPFFSPLYCDEPGRVTYPKIGFSKSIREIIEHYEIFFMPAGSPLQIFSIFDDFSKFHSVFFHFKKLSNIWQKFEGTALCVIFTILVSF